MIECCCCNVSLRASESLLADVTDQLRSAEDERDRVRAELQEMVRLVGEAERSEARMDYFQDRIGPDQSMFEEREQELNSNLRNAEETIFRLRAEVRELKAQK